LWRNWWNEDWQGKLKYLEKTWPSATLSTTNPTWPDPGLNPGRHSGKPATNRLSYGAAMVIVKQLVEWELSGEPKYSEKTCPSATLSIKNPTWLDPGSNPGHRHGKTVTNCLSYGMALQNMFHNMSQGSIICMHFEGYQDAPSSILFCTRAIVNFLSAWLPTQWETFSKAQQWRCPTLKGVNRHHPKITKSGEKFFKQH
jgi:hypothetical protein